MATPRDSQTWASNQNTGQSPVIVLDEAGDKQIIEVLNFHAPDYQISNYGDVYPGVISDDGTGATLYNTFKLTDWTNLRYPIIRRTWQDLPGSWVYTEKVDDQMLSVVIQKKRKNVGANIVPKALVKTGSSATITASISGGAVSSTTITNGGSGYGEIVMLSFTGNATGYALTTNGVITSVVVENPGSGYGGAPTITVLPNTLEVTDRQDINKYLAYEVVTIIPQPKASSFASAIPSETTRSYAFPERINAVAIRNTTLVNHYWNRPSAQNIPVSRKTWYVVSQTEPTLPLDSIIYTSPITLNSACSVGAGSPSSLGTFTNVLHDAINEVLGFNPCGLGNILMPVNYPATTPSFSEYEGIVYLTGTSVTLTNGSSAMTGVGTSFLSQLQAGDDFFGATVQSVTDNTNAVLTANWTGATGTYLTLYVTRPGAGWVGNYKNIFGSVTPTKYQMLWECVVDEILMR